MTSRKSALTILLLVLLVPLFDGSPPTGAASVPLSSGIEVLLSSSSRLTLRLHVGPMTVVSGTTPAGVFQRIVGHERAVSLRHGPELVSRPELPQRTLYVALPIGRSATLSITPEGIATQLASRLYPIQPPRRSAAGANPGDPYPPESSNFVFDPATYAAGASSVAQPLSFVPLSLPGSNIHGLTVGLVDVDPSGETFRYSSLLVDLVFQTGSPTCFKRLRVPVGVSLDEVDQRLEPLSSSTEASVINRARLTDTTCIEEILPTDVGARFIIVVPPPLRAAADALAQHRNTRGISTRVVETSALAPSAPLTDETLRTYLQAAWDGWAVQPRWLLLLGDADQIPTHYEAPNIWDSARNAGDQYYGLADGPISVPLLGVGRFPVDTPAEAQMIVDRVVAIESSPPPSTSAFYVRTSLAAQFQDDDLDNREDRRYVETSENVRTHLLAQGREAQRLYTAPAASSPTWWQGGVAIPMDLRRPLFSWAAATGEIVGAFNAGVSVFLHRDHGWWWGWAAPLFATTNLASVSAPGTQSPVLFSVNCASGIFDNETVDLPAHRVGAGYGPDPSAVYFAEQLLRKSGGALALIGDSRSSDTTLNNELAKGLFDALYPGYLPFGPEQPVKRLGDLLNHAKSYLRERAPSPQSLSQQLTIYNLLGDPSAELLNEAPLPLGLGSLATVGELLLVPLLPVAPCLGCPLPTLPLGQIVATALDDGSGALLARGVPGQGGVVALRVGGWQGRLRLHVSGSGVRPVTRLVDLP